ncbi:MAG: TetR/AcrR family transcriptional regulator [Actinomycetota bacterium]
MANPPDRETGATRERIVTAAVETIKTHGLTGASARAIGKTGGFNQALIYYYFPNLTSLYLAALEHTSNARMNAYLARMTDIGSLDDLVRVGGELFDEDVGAGHITVLAELVASALAQPELGARITELMEPWVRLTQDTIDRFVRGTFLEPMIQTGAIAQALVAFYLGIEMLYHLDRDRSRTDALFAMLKALAPIAAPFLASSPRPGGEDDE